MASGTRPCRQRKGSGTFICHDRIHQTLSPAIQATCLLTEALTLFFPNPPLGGRFEGRLTPLPRKILPTILAQMPPLGPVTPPGGPPPGGPTSETPTHRLDTHPPANYRKPPGEPAGIGTAREVSASIMTMGFYAIYEPKQSGRGYNSSQPLPNLENTLLFPPQHEGSASSTTGEAPASYPWVPKFLPEQWVYTDGSDITGHP